MSTVTGKDTVLYISDRTVDEARSIHQHDYDDRLAPARGFFYGALIAVPLWTVIVAIVAWWVF